MQAYKRLLFGLVWLGFSIVARSQLSIGFNAGVSSNYLRAGIANRMTAAIERKEGYALSVSFQYKFCSWFYLEGLPGLTPKDYAMVRTDALAGVYERYNNTYLQLPLTANFAYGKRLQVLAGAGIYVGYWLSARIQGKVPNIFSVSDSVNPGTGQQVESFQLTTYNQNDAFNARRDRRWEIGWTASAGLRYEIVKGFSVLAESAFFQSLSDQQKHYMQNQTPQYNETVVFSVGGLYSFR